MKVDTGANVWDGYLLMISNILCLSLFVYAEPCLCRVTAFSCYLSAEFMLSNENCIHEYSVPTMETIRPMVPYFIN